MFEPGNRGQGADLIKNIQIHSLQEQVSNLTNEKFKAEAECNRLRWELEKLSADPTYLARLEEKVKRLEREEQDAHTRIAQKLTEIADLKDAAARSQKFADAFGADAQKEFNRLQEGWEKKNVLVRSLGGFVLGVAASIAAALLFDLLSTAN